MKEKTKQKMMSKFFQSFFSFHVLLQNIWEKRTRETKLSKRDSLWLEN